MNSLRTVAAGALAAVLVSVAVPAWSEERPGEAMAVAQRLTDDSLRAFNAHNVAAFAANYAADCDGVSVAHNASVDRFEFVKVRGRGEVQGVLEVFFEQYPKARLDKSVQSARFITPEVLVVDASFDVLGLPADAGPVSGMVTIIYGKQGDRWLALCERLVAHPPKPAGERNLTTGSKN